MSHPNSEVNVVKSEDWRQPPPPIPEELYAQTYQADIVIIGAGQSGTAAARSAAETSASPSHGSVKPNCDRSTLRIYTSSSSFKNKCAFAYANNFSMSNFPSISLSVRPHGALLLFYFIIACLRPPQ